MAAASYTTNLAVIADFETTPTMGEMVNYALGGTPAIDTDYEIQGSQHAVATVTKTGLNSIMVDRGSAITGWVSGHHVFVWATFLPATGISGVSSGGMRMLCGADITTNYKVWTCGGNDFGRYPYGGWQNFAFDPEKASDTGYAAGNAAGTVSNTQYRWFGVGINCTVAGLKGSPLSIDVVRYGRGDIVVTGGDGTNGYATFAGMAAANDDNNARWGLFQAVAGGYLWKGLMSLGTSGTAVDFRDQNKSVVIDNQLAVTSAFNKIEVTNANSRVDWTAVSITSLNATSKGDFVCVNDADINWSNCTFTDMGYFTFQAQSVIDGCIFRRCGIVTQAGATISNCKFDAASDTKALIASNVSAVTNCDFVSSGTGYAIEGFSTAGDYTVATNSFTGYGATGTANAALRVTATTGTVNISAPGGTTYHSAGATVNIISGQRTLTLTGIVSGSDIVITTSDTNTERANINENSGSTYAYSYTYATNDRVDVRVFKAGYVPFSVYDYLLADGDASLPINQVVDRNYQ